jgi:hypothetical protein
VSAVGFRRCFGPIAGLILAVVAAGCSHVTAVAAHKPLNVALMEYRLRPAKVLAASGHLRINVTNFGRLTHNFAIQTTQSGTTTTLARTPDLAPGTATTMTVTLPDGRYTTASTVNSDQSLGEQGTLTVASK